MTLPGSTAVSMLAGAAPPEPDADQAREWVNQELSGPEYGDQVTWLTRVIRNVVQWVIDIFSQTGTPNSLRGLVIGGAIVLVLLVLGIIVWRNPLTRRARSKFVFEEDTSLADAQTHADQARQAGDWSQAFIWTFRILVLVMAQRQVCSAGPGVTANEAARTISARLGFSTELSQAALQFDQVRYGDGVPDAADVDHLASLSATLESAADNLERPDHAEQAGNDDQSPVHPAGVPSLHADADAGSTHDGGRS